MLLRLLFILLCLPCLAGAQVPPVEKTPGMQAVLDRESARIGESVSLTLKVVLPEGARLPDPPEIKGVETLTLTGMKKQDHGLVLTFLVDRLGQWKTDPISLSYLRGDGTKDTFTAEPVFLQVQSGLGEKPEEAELRPLYEIIPVTSWWRSYLPWMACGLGVLLVGALAVWWGRKRRKTVDTGPAGVSPWVLAKGAIEELEGRKLFERGHVKEFYFRCSEILRQYMEALRGFPAAELTTEEIALKISDDRDRRLLPLLRHADMVKFADTVPTLARKEDEVREMLAYIEETGQVLEQNTRNRSV
jgi:hypothetical protein